MTKKDFPNGTRVISGVALSEEAFEAAGKLLEAGLELHRREQELNSLLPKGCYTQFFGKWDLLRINIAEEPEENET